MRARKNRSRNRQQRRFEPLEQRVVLTGFTAYNTLFAGPDTNPNTTLFSDMGGADASGQLIDVESGETTQVLLSTSEIGADFDDRGTNPAPGTDAHDIFDGFVDFTVGVDRSIELEPGDTYQYTFENLDGGATYQFAGTAVRGNNAYTDRWTLIQIEGADSFTPAHSAGIGVLNDGLELNQVVIWTGHNAAADQGYVAQWLDIDPGDDGTFHVVSSQYQGEIPAEIDAGGQADASKAYGVSAIRLIEDIPAGPPVVENIAATDVLAFEATVGGRITTTGGQIPNVKIYYGTDDGGTDPGAWQNVINIGGASRGFSAVLDDLQQGSQYYFRAFAENTLGNDWADASDSFTTLVASSPSLINHDAVNVGAFAAVLGGEILNTGNDPPIARIYYGDNDGGSHANAWDFSLDIEVQTGSFATAIADLVPLTEYFFTTFAQNRMGSSWATPSKSFTTTDTPPLQINEIMADNATVLRTRVRATIGDPFRGDRLTPDWIEIHNPTDQATDLGGFHLTDDLDLPTRWRIPSGTFIPAGGYVVVFASGLNIVDSRLDENGYLHTNFQLDGAGGDDIALTDAEGEVVFVLESTPIQSEDISYGINTAAEPRFFLEPTPADGNANDTPKAPTISTSSSTFSDAISVEIIPHLPSHKIYYTLNERVPTTSSTRYTGPITISSTSQLRAISVGANGKSSVTVSETYVEISSNLANTNSNLPYVLVETFGDGIPGRGSDFGDIFIAMIEPGEDGRSHITSDFDLTTRGGIHVRGSSSAGFSKKQYRVEFWDEQNEDQKQAVLGLPKEADWIFYGPSQYDRVLISNPLMFDLSNQIGRYATRTKWVEMYFNNGGTLSSSDYAGVYAITEVIEEGDGRIDLGGPLTTGAGGVPVEGGFIWKNDRGSPYVDPDTTTSAQRRYIDGWINNLRSAAATRNLDNFAQYADVGSFIDHNILNLLAMNVDALRLSSFYYKTPDGKLEAGPIWDFDRSLESTDGRDNNARTWYGTGDSTRNFDDSGRVMSWWPDMFQNQDFTQAYIDRWFELRQNEFSLENINATIDRHAAELSEAAPRDYSRWSRSRFGNFAGEINHLKTWLRQRIEWIDSQWIEPPTFSEPLAHVAAGTPIGITPAEGDIYYTLDGSDPRGENGSIAASATRLTGTIPINGFTRITARSFESGHGRNQPYIHSGDDWSPPVQMVYFHDQPAGSENISIAEVHYNPAQPTNAEIAAGYDNNDDFEYLEFVNTSNENLVLTGARLGTVEIASDSQGVDFDFASGNIEVLAPGDRVLVVEDMNAFRFRYGDNHPVAGQWNGGLSNSGETITLFGFDHSIIQQFRYNDSGDWPERADGLGSSLEVIDVQSDLNLANNWRPSHNFGGSPGTEDDPGSGIVINEVLAHTDPPRTPSDTIELFNPTPSDVAIGGMYLSDSANDFFKFQIPAGTMLGSGEYIVFDEGDFNPNPEEPGPGAFALSSANGDDVWLIRGDGELVFQFVDDVHFSATRNGESLGRTPNGSGPLARMSKRTLGGPNASPEVGPVVLSEINYAPGNPSINAVVLYPGMTADDLEYVEIYNPTPNPMDLTEWRIRGGVDYDFEPDTILPSLGTTLILSFHPHKPENASRWAAFQAHYGMDQSVSVVGGYSGQLSDLGETVRLQRPDDPPADDPHLIPRLLEDEVRYFANADWPQVNGNGLTLTRNSVDSFGNDSSSWSAAEPSLSANEIIGDVNQDGVIDARDVDLVCHAAFENDSQFDLNGDGATNRTDVELLVESILRTSAGDSNVDGVFNSTDLILVFQAGEYEDAIDGNSRWSSGDWNCDGDFTSGDLVTAFQAGTYSSAAVSESMATAKVAALVNRNDYHPIQSDFTNVKAFTEGDFLRPNQQALDYIEVKPSFDLKPHSDDSIHLKKTESDEATHSEHVS